MELLEALTTVLEIAGDNALDRDDPDMAQEAERQHKAIRLVERLLLQVRSKQTLETINGGYIIATHTSANLRGVRPGERVSRLILVVRRWRDPGADNFEYIVAVQYGTVQEEDQTVKWDREWSHGNYFPSRHTPLLTSLREAYETFQQKWESRLKAM